MNNGIKFFIFGAGNRRKLLYKNGILSDAWSGEVIVSIKVRKEIINDELLTVEITSQADEHIVIYENEIGIHLANNGNCEILSEAPVKLPDFQGHPYPRMLRILHHEILINIFDGKPLPNFLVYQKPWYRDAAMMAMVLEKTGNISLLYDWIRSLREPYDRNNAGEQEPDNLGQLLYLISLLPDADDHPLIPEILEEARRRTTNGSLNGLTDFGEHPVYQTKWMKYGLKGLNLADNYTVPQVDDTYGKLFWWDKDEIIGVQRSFREKKLYPYLTWAEAHFFEDELPLSFAGTSFPLTWEACASHADYEGMNVIDEFLTENKVCLPHTWHAAEMFLYLIKQEK